MIGTWTADWLDKPADDALRRLAPDAAALLDDLVAQTPSSVAQLTCAVREACAATLSLTPLPAHNAEMAECSLPGGEDMIARAFAEQFSVDVSSVDESMRSELQRALGNRTMDFVTALYVADWAPRVRRALDQLFSPSEWTIAAQVRGPADGLWSLVDAFMRSVAQLRELDPVTTEMVRLREARQHNCRICKSLRSRSALSTGIGEEAFDDLDSYQDSALSTRHKVALTLADALIWQPGYIDEAVISEVREHFSPAEAVELVLDMMRNACSKIAVAMGSDEANVTEGVQLYDINDDGTVDLTASAPAN